MRRGGQEVEGLSGVAGLEEREGHLGHDADEVDRRDGEPSRPRASRAPVTAACASPSVASKTAAAAMTSGRRYGARAAASRASSMRCRAVAWSPTTYAVIALDEPEQADHSGSSARSAAACRARPRPSRRPGGSRPGRPGAGRAGPAVIPGRASSLVVQRSPVVLASTNCHRRLSARPCRRRDVDRGGARGVGEGLEVVVVGAGDVLDGSSDSGGVAPDAGEPLRVPLAGGVDLARGGELVEGEVADRPQHPEGERRGGALDAEQVVAGELAHGPLDVTGAGPVDRPGGRGGRVRRRRRAGAGRRGPRGRAARPPR